MSSKHAKKYVAVCVAVLLALTTLLCGCGYNKLMRDYLSNADNYFNFVLEVIEINVWNDSSNCFKAITCADDIDVHNMRYVGIKCKIISGSADSNAYDDEFYTSQPELSFEISQANALQLQSTDFFDIVKIGDQLDVRSTVWIYMDGEFNYLAEISLYGVTYLQFDKGLQNIIDYMNANKSLL